MTQAAGGFGGGAEELGGCFVTVAADLRPLQPAEGQVKDWLKRVESNTAALKLTIDEAAVMRQVDALATRIQQRLQSVLAVQAPAGGLATPQGGAGAGGGTTTAATVASIYTGFKAASSEIEDEYSKKLQQNVRLTNEGVKYAIGRLGVTGHLPAASQMRREFGGTTDVISAILADARDEVSAVKELRKTRVERRAELRQALVEGVQEEAAGLDDAATTGRGRGGGAPGGRRLSGIGGLNLLGGHLRSLVRAVGPIAAFYAAERTLTQIGEAAQTYNTAGRESDALRGLQQSGTPILTGGDAFLRGRASALEQSRGQLRRGEMVESLPLVGVGARIASAFMGTREAFAREQSKIEESMGAYVQGIGAGRQAQVGLTGIRRGQFVAAEQQQQLQFQDLYRFIGEKVGWSAVKGTPLEGALQQVAGLRVAESQRNAESQVAYQQGITAQGKVGALTAGAALAPDRAQIVSQNEARLISLRAQQATELAKTPTEDRTKVLTAQKQEELAVEQQGQRQLLDYDRQTVIQRRQIETAGQSALLTARREYFSAERVEFETAAAAEIESVRYKETTIQQATLKGIADRRQAMLLQQGEITRQGIQAGVTGQIGAIFGQQTVAAQAAGDQISAIRWQYAAEQAGRANRQREELRPIENDPLRKVEADRLRARHEEENRLADAQEQFNEVQYQRAQFVEQESLKGSIAANAARMVHHDITAGIIEAGAASLTRIRTTEDPVTRELVRQDVVARQRVELQRLSGGYGGYGAQVQTRGIGMAPNPFDARYADIAGARQAARRNIAEAQRQQGVAQERPFDVKGIDKVQKVLDQILGVIKARLQQSYQ